MDVLTAFLLTLCLISIVFSASVKNQTRFLAWINFGWLILHRGWCAYETWYQVDLWRLGRPTNLFSDWLEEDFFLTMLLPVVIIECTLAVRRFLAFRARDESPWRRPAQVALWLLPEAILLALLFQLWEQAH